MPTVGDILAAVDALAPLRLAESWDNVGLLLGDTARPVRRVLVSLDVSEAVCDEADGLAADVLLTHHPLFFKPVDRLTTETRTGRLALRLAGAGRAVLAAHTNLDAAEGGLCDLLAEGLGLGDLRPLRAEAPGPHAYKVVVFAPASDLEAVRAAAFEAGAGRIGDYAECGFSVEGTGTFLPGPGAEPAVGQVGRRETVREHRLEVLVDAGHVRRVVAAITRAHSYEEPAIDVYPLQATAGETGIGRAGEFAQPVPLADLVARVKAVLGLPAAWAAGAPDRAVRRVAVVTGVGSGLADAVADARCDAYVTGELKYHEAEGLAAGGIAVILGGHYRTERVPLERWADRLAKTVAGVDVAMSAAERPALEWR